MFNFDSTDVRMGFSTDYIVLTTKGRHKLQLVNNICDILKIIIYRTNIYLEVLTETDKITSIQYSYSLNYSLIGILGLKFEDMGCHLLNYYLPIILKDL